MNQNQENNKEQQNIPQTTVTINQTIDQPTPKKKPFYKKWWFWLIIVFAVLIIGSASCANKSPKKEPAKESGENSTDTTTAQPQDTTFALNETAVFDTIKVTANKLEESSGTDFFTPETGNTFVGVQFTIENISDKDQSISSILLFDAYVDGVKCDYSISAACTFTDGTLDGTLSPGKKMVGYYSVEVPAEWSELELQVKSSWLSSSKAAFVFNK